MTDIIKFLEEKQKQLTKEALTINDCLINYDRGEIEYTKDEVDQMCLDRDEKEQKAVFLFELIDELEGYTDKYEYWYEVVGHVYSPEPPYSGEIRRRYQTLEAALIDYNKSNEIESILKCWSNPYDPMDYNEKEIRTKIK